MRCIRSCVRARPILRTPPSSTPDEDPFELAPRTYPSCTLCHRPLKQSTAGHRCWMRYDRIVHRKWARGRARVGPCRRAPPGLSPRQRAPVAAQAPPREGRPRRPRAESAAVAARLGQRRQEAAPCCERRSRPAARTAIGGGRSGGPLPAAWLRLRLSVRAASGAVPVGVAQRRCAKLGYALGGSREVLWIGAGRGAHRHLGDLHVAGLLPMLGVVAPRVARHLQSAQGPYGASSLTKGPRARRFRVSCAAPGICRDGNRTPPRCLGLRRSPPWENDRRMVEWVWGWERERPFSKNECSTKRGQDASSVGRACSLRVRKRHTATFRARRSDLAGIRADSKAGTRSCRTRTRASTQTPPKSNGAGSAEKHPRRAVR